jgi:hypothetical protein
MFNKSNLTKSTIGVVAIIIVYLCFIWNVFDSTTPKSPKFYQDGEIVYIKPDSIKAMVMHNYAFGRSYHVKYTDKMGVIHYTSVNGTELY